MRALKRRQRHKYKALRLMVGDHSDIDFEVPKGTTVGIIGQKGYWSDAGTFESPFRASELVRNMTFEM